MKIRQSFVSNSSSCSFIVGVLKESNKCPTCGRGGNQAEHVIEISDSDETQIRDDDIDSFVQDLEEEIKQYKQRIKQLEKDPRSKASWYKTSESEIKAYEDMINKNEERIENITNLQRQCKYIFTCDISNHDERTYQDFNAMVNNNEILMEIMYEG